MLNKLAKENDFGLRRLAVIGLGNHKNAASFQALQNILENEKDDSVLAEAAIALQYSQQSQAKELIAKLQQDEHYRVVAAALEVAASWDNT
nr:HEAT repeat domain-containing protein [Calothrix elsteri]